MHYVKLCLTTCIKKFYDDDDVRKIQNHTTVTGFVMGLGISKQY